MRTFKDYLLIFAKGMGMGAADVVPGVSGGTIAFISGVYEELLNSLQSINLVNLQLLLRLQLVSFWKAINGNFLLSIFLGVLVSIVSLAKLITYLLENHPIKVWSFFFGLVIISAITVLRQIERWKLSVVVGLISGVVIAYMITIATPAATPNTWWFTFLSGMIAISAMILPGVSGAFILLILGKYKYVTGALHEFDFGVILVFVAGCITGLMSFVRLVSWVLDKYHQVTIAVLSGFMIGSLNKVWPWKEVVSYRIDSDGNQVTALDQSVFPNHYYDVTGNDPEILQAILLIAMGIVVVVILEKVATRSSVK
jgi:putative membrane protein